jgi:hypothetical protein
VDIDEPIRAVRGVSRAIGVEPDHGSAGVERISGHHFQRHDELAVGLLHDAGPGGLVARTQIEPTDTGRAERVVQVAACREAPDEEIPRSSWKRAVEDPSREDDFAVAL